MNNLVFEEAYLNMLEGGAEKQDRLSYLKDFYNNKEVIEKADVIELFNIAFMDEFLAEFNYFASWNLSQTEGKNDFDPEFKQHETEERDHRYEITNRLRELGAPVPSKVLQEFFTMNSSGENWKQELMTSSKDILLNRYNEELGAIEFYGLFFKTLRRLPEDERDTTSEMVVKKLKADEEEHAKDLKDLLVENGILTNDVAPKAEEQEEKPAEETTEEAPVSENE